MPVPNPSTVRRVIEARFPELHSRNYGHPTDPHHTLLYDTVHLDAEADWRKVGDQIAQLVGHLEGVNVSWFGAEVEVKIQKRTRRLAGRN